MPFIALIVGATIAVVAVRGTQGQLATALETDLPPYLKWAAALGGLGVLGFIPGFTTLSRWLIALVLVVIVLRNYQQVLSSFQQLTQAPQASTVPTTGQQQFASATQSISGLQAAVAGATSTLGPAGPLSPLTTGSGFGSPEIASP